MKKKKGNMVYVACIRDTPKGPKMGIWEKPVYDPVAKLSIKMGFAFETKKACQNYLDIMCKASKFIQENYKTGDVRGVLMTNEKSKKACVIQAV